MTKPDEKAVEAALALADAPRNSGAEFEAMISILALAESGKHSAYCTAAHILAAEVRWLRDGRDKTRQSLSSQP